MESRQLTGLVVALFIVASATGESGFLVTAPQRFLADSTDKVCTTFYNLREKTLTIRIKKSGTIYAEITETPTEDDICLDLKVPIMPPSSRYSGPEESIQVQLEAEVSGRTINGRLFSDNQRKDIYISNMKRIETYIQTDKPIYKAGQTVKFRILTLEYPDLKPYIQKIRRVYVEEPGGRRVQQWNIVDTQSGLAELEMPLSPEPPLGDWTIFAAVGGEKVRQSFEVGEYVLPKFEVKILPQPSYVYKRAEEVIVKICGEYSYGEPVRGSIQANISTSQENRWIRAPWPPVEITRQIEDTGSDGCHTFRIDSSDLSLTELFEWNAYSFSKSKLHVDAAFTEQGTDVTFVENSDVANLVNTLYELTIDGPDAFKPGLPYHGVVRLTYPDKYPVSNKNVEVELTNYEGGATFRKLVTVRVSNGVGKFEISPPLSALNTKMKITAKVTAHEGEPYAEDITAYKYVQAWYSPSGNFLQVAPSSGGKQSGQEDNIEVDYTVPSGQTTMTFHYKIVSRGNIVHSGQRTVAVDGRMTQPDVGILPIPHGQLGTVIGHAGQGFWQPTRPRQRVRRSVRVEEPSLPPYESTTVARLSLPFNVSSHMGPKSSVLVYYIRNDGEIISGSSEFTVNNVFENQVSLDFGSAEAQPAAQIQLTVNASPQSLCALGVVDKSVHILRDSNQLTAQKVQGPLDAFNRVSYPLNPSTRCSDSYDSYPGEKPIPPLPPRPGVSGPQPRPGVPGPSLEWLRIRRRRESGDTEQSRQTRRALYMYEPAVRTTLFSRHLDALTAFKNTGMVLLTNLNVESRPCYKRIQDRSRFTPTYGIHYGLPGPGGGDRVRGPMGPMSRPVQVTFKLHSLDVEDNSKSGRFVSVPREDTASPPLVEIRSYFPETWLWLLTTTGDSGSASINSEVPHTITEWVANGFCTSANSGFGIAEPVELRAFQPFFLSYNLPYSAIREESIPVDVTVFNYLTECFTIELSMDQSMEFSLVDASPNKYVCVCDRESKTVNFTIIPRQIGEIKITVHGSYAAPGPNVPLCGNNVFLPNVDGVRDAIEDTLLVEPEGVEREETFSEMVCLEEVAPNFSTVVPLSVPTDVIQDSARGRIFISGDMMGSVLSNLDSILKMPTGCGEQNMVKFAPNIYVLDYLTSTNQLTREIENKALEYLRIGYQRELTYRLQDGSYSAFGERDEEGSTWLTAFVLKSYVQANRFINIDTSDITVTQNWLLNQQDPLTGCFRNRGILRHQSMKGGISDEVTLTAYVLAALVEAGVMSDHRQVTLAEKCITDRLTELYSDPYALALVTYALLLAENPDGSVGLQQLDRLARMEAGGLMYWKRTDDEPVDSDCTYCSPPSAMVEMTSYALLAYLTSDAKDEADAMPIVRWMNQQRSALGGYSSTQDTVMGLQSLSQYASETYRNYTNMAIDVVETNTGAFLQRFVVFSENKLLTQRMELDEVPTTLTFDARGEGCALVQAEIRYNVPAVRVIRRDPFEITLDMLPPDSTQHCGTKILTTCIRYIGPRETTNMAAVEFKMVTGYNVDMESLAMYLQEHGQAIGLKRVDPPSKGNPLVLYFDYFDSTQRCFEVTVKQKVFVDSAKPASIKVYDYYEPGVKSYKSYNTCPPKDEKQSGGKAKI